MGEVAASVALVEATAPPVAPTPAPQNSGKTVEFGDGRVVSFVDSAESPANREASILDEVLGGETAEPVETTEADPDKTPVDKPADKPAEKPPEPAKTEPATEPTNDVEAARLRRGFAKLAEEKQKVIERENAARAAHTAAQQYQAKAAKHDEVMAKLAEDPASFLLSHGGEELVQKALKGFIEMEKSPAEREVAKLRQEQADRDRKQAEREQTQAVETWRNGIYAKVSSDERFDLVNALGLHAKVVDVITAYYEKHSQRDGEGRVTSPAILQWDQAAQAVEDAHATALDKSKRYGKRAPAAAEATPPKKDTPPAKQPASGTAKKPPTSLSSVPVADSPPSSEDDLPSDDNAERERRLLKELFG